ncbi:hypothetical protein PoB_006519000 [Plakobranchus ocellatus]|uniref:Uncharacterized protein n=1 Tax=Plakobranchus ocellatus TaxID=259542 RepID=A0AAV4D3X9_9GAST|nr:hypothetical protein PoB_006519000 [Plakobranchus ocellatus]
MNLFLAARFSQPNFTAHCYHTTKQRVSVFSKAWSACITLLRSPHIARPWHSLTQDTSFTQKTPLCMPGPLLKSNDRGARG